MIVVTGADGQLGQCLRKEYEKYALDEPILFLNKNEMDITDVTSIRDVMTDKVLQKYSDRGQLHPPKGGCLSKG